MRRTARFGIRLDHLKNYEKLERYRMKLFFSNSYWHLEARKNGSPQQRSRINNRTTERTLCQKMHSQSFPYSLHQLALERLVSEQMAQRRAHGGTWHLHHAGQHIGQAACSYSATPDNISAAAKLKPPSNARLRTLFVNVICAKCPRFPGHTVVSERGQRGSPSRLWCGTQVYSMF